MSLNPLVNAMTVDVEDYFHVSAFHEVIRSEDWSSFKSRIEVNVSRILEIFARYQVSATFFVLGWVAEKSPLLIRKISDAGHEIASHGYFHQRVSHLTPTEFKSDLVLSRDLLEQITGKQILGYRAPSFSINTKNLWAFDILQQSGFRYSSSVFPGRHDHYGIPGAPMSSFTPVTRQGLIEIPMSLMCCGPLQLPSSGGGFFRLYPYWLSRFAINYLNEVTGKPLVFYFHPWEIDLQQPVIREASLQSRFRHYINISKVESRLEKLLTDFSWGRIDQVYF